MLDAARTTVLDFGVRRTTLTEVARRAGVSRMTVYRRFKDAPELMRALMSREFGAVLAAAERDAARGGSGLERVVRGVMLTVEALTEHPLLRRLLELEPDVLLPYLADRVGEFQRGGRAALARWIAAEQAAGQIRQGDPERLAAAIEMAARGVVVASRSLSGDELSAALGELRLMVRAYLQRS